MGVAAVVVMCCGGGCDHLLVLLEGHRRAKVNQLHHPRLVQQQAVREVVMRGREQAA